MVGPVRHGLMTAVIALAFISLARAEQAAPGGLARAAREAAAGFAPITAQDVARSKADFATAVQQLERFLNGGGAAKVAGWKRYLAWNDLQALATQEAPPQDAQVGPIVAKLTDDKTGLDLKHFTRVRETLQSYADTAGAAANAKLQEEYAQRLEKLAGHFEAYEKNPASGDDALAIAQTLGWLSRSRQAGSLLTSAREAYSRPNVYGFMAKRLLAVGIEDDVDRVTPVRENILGTSLFGTGRMVGRTTLVLNENPNVASYTVLLGGRVYSNSVGYNGPVTVHTTALTTVSASKQFSMSETGMTSTRSSAGARSSSRINSLSAKHRLIERIAWKKAGQQKGQAEAIGSARAQTRIAREMDQQAGELIAEQNDSYLNKFRRPLIRKGGFPDEMTFSTTSERLEFRMMQAQLGQIGAPVTPPAHEGQYDLAVQAHESAVVNFAEILVGGTTLTDEQLVKIIRDDLKAEVPEELQITPDKDPWSITFAKETPFRAQFVNQGVKMALRGTMFTRGEQRINEPIEISANYTIEKAGGGSKLTRQGDVEVTYMQRERLGATQVAFKTFLRRKFEALFKPEMVSDGLQLKGRLAKAGKLQLKELKSDAAWLVLGWEMPGTPATVASVARVE